MLIKFGVITMNKTEQKRLIKEGEKLILDYQKKIKVVQKEIKRLKDQPTSKKKKILI